MVADRGAFPPVGPRRSRSSRNRRPRFAFGADLRRGIRGGHRMAAPEAGQNAVSQPAPFAVAVCRHRMHRPHRSSHLLALVALTTALAAQGTPIGFEETFALSADRAKAVATLIPGTDDWYYYHCRERLAARDFATVRTLLPTWLQRHGRGARLQEIETREALLSFDGDRERTFRYVIDRLGLQWSHQPTIPGAKSSLPTRLAPAQADTGTLRTNLLATHPDSLDRFTDAALPELAKFPLFDGQLVALL